MNSKNKVLSNHDPDEQRQSIHMEGKPLRDGTAFDILAITAGEGNGWSFSPDVLRAAVPLFDQTQCFIDHIPPKSGTNHSVRDLAGILTAPLWDESVQGIRCRLMPLGPAADLLIETGRQILAAVDTDPKVGFSADLSFRSNGQNVEQIHRIFSVDLVVDPARGGAFLKAVNAVQKREDLAAESLDGQDERITLGNDEILQPDDSQKKLQNYLLETALASSQLPQPLQAHIRRDFQQRSFDPAELETAIDEARTIVSSLIGGNSINGVSSRVEAMVSSSDQVNAAVHDLLGARRPDELRSIRTQKLAGIRELYTMMTGDLDFHGGYDPQRASLSESGDLPAILKNVLNKLVAQRWEELGASGYHWWEKIVTIEHFNSLQNITGILVGEISLLPSINEGAAYTELGVSDSAETGTWEKYGGYLGLTIEMFERDDTRRLRQFPFKLATAGLRRLSALVGEIFTASAGAGPMMADGKNVFESSVHQNLGAGVLSSESWEAASAAIYNQKLLVNAGGTAPKQAIDARYLVVPRTLRLTAERILYPSMAWEPNITSENLQRGQFGDVVTCPEFSDSNDWAAVADPLLAPAIYIGERFGIMPEIYIADNQLSGALFTNDEVRIKARHFLSVFVADYRPLYKANAVNE